MRALGTSSLEYRLLMNRPRKRIIRTAEDILNTHDCGFSLWIEEICEYLIDYQ